MSAQERGIGLSPPDLPPCIRIQIGFGSTGWGKLNGNYLMICLIVMSFISIVVCCAVNSIWVRCVAAFGVMRLNEALVCSVVLKCVLLARTIGYSLM